MRGRRTAGPAARWDWAAVRRGCGWLNCAVFSFSTTPAAARSFSFSRRPSFSASRHSWRSSVGDVAQVGVERRLGADRLGFAAGIDQRGRPRRGRGGPARDRPRPAGARRRGLTSTCNWPSRVMPIASSLRASTGPMPGSSRTGSGASRRCRLGRADHREAARLVAAGGDLGQQPVGGQADRDGDADLALHLRGRSGPAPRRAARRAAPRCRRGPAPPRRSTAAGAAASGRPSGRGPGGRRRRIWRSRGGSPRRPGQAFSALNIGMALRTP